jgi:hypothetical protein
MNLLNKARPSLDATHYAVGIELANCAAESLAVAAQLGDDDTS